MSGVAAYVRCAPALSDRVLALTLGTAWVVAFLAVVSPALGGTAAVRTDRVGRDAGRDLLVYRAGSGERNRLTQRASDGALILRDPAGIDPGKGCRRTEPPSLDTVRCRYKISFDEELEEASLIVFLGDRDDRVLLDRGAPGAMLDGGPGRDVLRSSGANNVLRGGPGDDRLIGRGAYDLFDEGPVANGHDELRAEGETSVVSYRRRSQPLRLSVRGRAIGGASGERDRISADRFGSFVTLEGGRGNDRLQAGRHSIKLIGGPGRDVLVGGPGSDSLYADSEARNPARAGRRRSSDSLFGGAGSDGLYGNRGPNLLVGGPGSDGVAAGAGNDTVRVRDDSLDSLSCGGGRDRGLLDVRDFFLVFPQSVCEELARIGPATAIAVPSGTEFDPGINQSFGYALVDCPPDGPRRCRGTVTYEYRNTVLGRKRFSITHGKSGFYIFRTTAAGRKLLRYGSLFRATAVAASADRAGLRRVVTTQGHLAGYRGE